MLKVTLLFAAVRTGTVSQRERVAVKGSLVYSLTDCSSRPRYRLRQTMEIAVDKAIVLRLPRGWNERLRMRRVFRGRRTGDSGEENQ